ncbi:CBM96 family carbohydrate-binding protein [Actinoplanes friuliensis]|uniref:CBM96 family carbohydrate-binding protein n=1 Tax=Actinoplanes friuliensis TaxID=196914 RepID=UPI0005A18151|nr:DNRLRE domain-containing protein [Actinoplanes friuliensis]
MTARRGIIGVALTGVVAAGGGFALTGTANAATTTETTSTYSTDDAYTSSSRRTVNFGAADKLVVGREAGETRLSYVKFTPKIASGATVTAAQLKLPVESKPVAATLSVHSVASSWSEQKITAANAPALGALVASIKPSTTDATLTFDVSKVVTKAGTYAFALRSSATTAVTRLRSIEYGATTSGGPELVVTARRTTTTPTTAPTSTAPTKAPTTAPTTTPPTTTPPTTTPPTTTPPTTVPPTTAPGECVTDALLVPSCGVLWGAAAGGFTDTPRDQALKSWEAMTGRTATIYHTYHKGDEQFPTKPEIAMTQDAQNPRVLLLNWKIAYNSTWAKVAAGAQDARIDKWSAYVKKNYNQKFFLALHHEPENDVNATAGSGMTAKDYAAMYRHVITRLRTNGVTNAVNVIAFMGNEKWMAQSWWKDLYPGDAYVDWVGLDSYVSVEKGYYHYGDMGDILDRQPTGGGLGWYDWAVKNHPTKPIMVAEWGMYHRTKSITDKAAAFNTVIPELKAHPAVKAVVYFDTASDDEGDRDISVNSTASSLAAFKKVAADPMFKVTLGK